MSSVNGGLSFLRWRSKWAELERAWTPVSVLLEMDRETGLSGLSLLMASCVQRISVTSFLQFRRISLSLTRQTNPGVHITTSINSTTCPHVSTSKWSWTPLLSVWCKGTFTAPLHEQLQSNYWQKRNSLEALEPTCILFQCIEKRWGSVYSCACCAQCCGYFLITVFYIKTLWKNRIVGSTTTWQTPLFLSTVPIFRGLDF